MVGLEILQPWEKLKIYQQNDFFLGLIRIHICLPSLMLKQDWGPEGAREPLGGWTPAVQDAGGACPGSVARVSSSLEKNISQGSVERSILQNKSLSFK